MRSTIPQYTFQPHMAMPPSPYNLTSASTQPSPWIQTLHSANSTTEVENGTFLATQQPHQSPIQPQQGFISINPTQKVFPYDTPNGSIMYQAATPYKSHFLQPTWQGYGLPSGIPQPTPLNIFQNRNDSYQSTPIPLIFLMGDLASFPRGQIRPVIQASKAFQKKTHPKGSTYRHRSAKNPRN